MAENKRRRLEGSGSSTPTAMSAFAARQQLWGAAAKIIPPVIEKTTPDPAPDDGSQSRRSEPLSARPVAVRRSKRRSAEDPKPTSFDTEGTLSSEGGESGSATPRIESTGTLVRQHSSFKPNKKSLQRKVGGRLVLTTTEAERLVILGSYGIKVREGEATVAGAVLTPADGLQWVHAPHCHAVPVLRTAEETVLDLQPHPAAKGLRQLAKLNPSFAKLWNEDSSQGADSGRGSKTSTTFQIIYTSQDVPKRAILQELVSPAEWNKKLSGLAAAKRKGTPVIFLCGPKSSGKSTFGRILANRFMTDRGGSRNKPMSSVMVLDLDPGQPEYSPPGVISLSKITVPNLSPSFCHPTLSPAEGQVRAHAIASVTPAFDPAHFIECALDLFAHYQRGPNAKCPLVINTPGWIQGTGLDILAELITSIRPTEVIYMSQDGPEETVSGLQSACASTTPVTPFTTLPSQPGDAASSRTSLHFRTMQTMSYFHLRQPDQQQQLPSWDPAPLTELRPWRVRYSGPNKGVLGILCYDHQPAPELLAEAINGTVLALVRLESRAALRDLTPFVVDDHTAADANPGLGPNNNDAQNQTKYTHTPTLPLIPNPLGLALSPKHSRLLGLVLIRGIDTANHELHVLTPLAEDVISTLSGEELVLVAGRFDTPTWAYSEDLYWRGAHARSGGKGGDNGDGEEEEDEEDEEKGEAGSGLELESSGDREGHDSKAEVPWVEMLHGSRGRAVGSKVWRVRRDLGRS
ncbi:hypothetical protein VTI74DRAFT_9592 [Chaetomium olivicolor]